MKLEHLIQAYNFNKIKAKITEENIESEEKAGVIKFNDNIHAAYLVDDENIVIALNIFCNCISKEHTAVAQLNHTSDVIKIIQTSINLIANIPQKECNLILESLGLFDSTFKERQKNKIFRTFI